MEPVHWDQGSWLNPPPAAEVTAAGLTVTTAGGSDFWRTTYYGFERDSGHALLTDLRVGEALEVDFVVDFEETYDQAGLLLRAAESRWVKAGVEMSDGAPQVGAVVTDGVSDWSCSPVPAWQGRTVTVRASLTPGAVVVRARAEGEPWILVRLAPFRTDVPVCAGAFCASPEREGLVVGFSAVRRGPADRELHA